MLKKILIWGSIAFVVFFAAFRPTAAVDVVTVIGESAVSILTGVGDFFGSLVN